MSSSLQFGSTLSHYRVISPLGAGGMGEVYMAQDTVLDRAAALKVLPPALMKTEERVTRFIQEAQAAGIVQRDLAAENIMNSGDGYAKVLDFGLAKLTEQRESTADATAALAATRDQTREGAVLGTVAYVSPEQVQARPVDHRSD